MAVNERTGDIVQVTEGGFRGTLLVARKSMKLYYMKNYKDENEDRKIIEIALDKLFEDSQQGNLKDEMYYQRVCGIILAEYETNSEMALDANKD